MAAGLIALIVAYGLSQFFRAFLAVLSPALAAEIGTTPDDLAFASGLWFLVFAAMQIPVGEALDRIGPRRTAAVLFALGAAGGAAGFALAQSPLHVTIAMAVIGAGCSPILMAGYFIFARTYPAAVFGTLAGMMIGFGNLGNIAGSVPLAAAVEAFGWRATMGGVAGLALAVAAVLAVTIKDPPRVRTEAGGSLLDILRIWPLWPILIMMAVNYAPAAALRGVWAGPYSADVFGADADRIGQVTLIMGLSMIAGSFAYGPLERRLGTRKWLIVAGNTLGALGCFGLWLTAGQSLWLSTAFLAMVGLFGASFPMIVAHARAYFPPQLTGRGVTLVNLFGIAGVGAMQVLTGRLFQSLGAEALPPDRAYGVIFLVMGVTLTVGVAVYLLSRDRTD